MHHVARRERRDRAEALWLVGQAWIEEGKRRRRAGEVVENAMGQEEVDRLEKEGRHEDLMQR